MKTDIEIANQAKLKPIVDIAKELEIDQDELELYGKYKAKVTDYGSKKGKLVLVTAINPTPAGEGKTTVSIGLADGIKALNKNVCLALREPSLGPVFGIKGGAAGGGYAQIAPMEDINLHFTGDFHAITSANNLLAAMIDNHIYWGNSLKIKNVTFHRCLDMNDRALRGVVVGIGTGKTREDIFDITAASEVMAILCLSKDFLDLKKRLGDIVIGTNEQGENVTARDLKADEGMAILLKDAIKPNLVQTLEGTPCMVHGGPFANIAHGCNSVIATKMALSHADYVITEAGFGADLGAEKFLDIKCRLNNLTPSCVVIVATIRALKSAGGLAKEELSQENLDALQKGLPNLIKHIENITKVYSLPCVVAINKFVSDTQKEVELVKNACKELGAKVELCECWAKGGQGSLELASTVLDIVDKSNPTLTFSYDINDTVKEKIEKIATKIYGADGVIFDENAKKLLDKFPNNIPVCIAKTQYSLSDNPSLLGRPTNFKITIRDLYYKAGAGFIVALAGKILLMPGLSKKPNAENMYIDEKEIKGLF